MREIEIIPIKYKKGDIVYFRYSDKLNHGVVIKPLAVICKSETEVHLRYEVVFKITEEGIPMYAVFGQSRLFPDLESCKQYWKDLSHE